MPEPHSLPEPGIRTLLSMEHARNAAKPIEWPNEAGVFPDSVLRTVPPVVVDANELFRDVAYAARTGRRTALIALANAGYIRLFCAPHVLEEIAEHADELAARLDAPRDAFHAWWSRTYLPLLRCVQVSEGFLTAEEAARIELLRAVDPDDVPSAVLALALGAYFYTRDRPAREAVYGPGVDHDVQDGTLKIIRSRGDEAVLEQYVHVLAMAPVGVGYGISKAVRWAWARSPWITVFALAGLGLAGWALPPERKQTIKTGAAIAWAVASPFLAEYAAAYGVLESVTAAPARWSALADELLPDTVVSRACVHTLARSGSSDLSATELARTLPHLGVPQGEARVRATLRAQACFTEVYRGRWQAGAPAYHASLIPNQRGGTHSTATPS